MKPKTFVVKIGVSVLTSGLPTGFTKDLKDLQMKNRVVLIHGGGEIVTETAKVMGKEQRFIVSPDGMRSRYTDRDTLEIYTMVMAGKINKQLVAMFSAYKINAVGLSGVDAFLISASRKKRLLIIDERGRKVAIDGGYTGKIETVRKDILTILLNEKFLPVISPIALDDEFSILNVDSDRAAAYIAGALKADALIMCTDVPGVKLMGKTVGKMGNYYAKENLSKIGHGMKKKVYAALESLNLGVKEIIITSGLIENPLTSAINHKAGTLIVNE